MLLAKALLVVFFIVVSVSGLTCPPPTERDADVLIFGAGAAGIAAAKTLYDNNMTNFIVLEARTDGLGGRVRNVRFAGVEVELGANWIHNYRRDLTTGPVNDRSCFPRGQELQGVTLDGSSIVYDQDPTNASRYVNANTAASQLNSRYEEVSQIISSASKSSTNPNISVRTALSNNGWRREGQSNTRLFDLVEWFNFDFDTAGSPDYASYRFTLSDDGFEDFGSDELFVTDQRGFVSLLECAARNITSKIQLGVTVNSISWNDECVCANVTRNGTDSVMCGSDGIVTFSLGVIQHWVNSNLSRFNPPFSARKVEAINQNSMNYLLKIFLEFPSRFWDRNVEFILRADPVRGRYVDFHTIGDVLPGNPNILLIFATGDEALRLGNGSMSNDMIKNEIMIALRQIYGDNIPSPTNILIPTWITDPLYRGMYTNFKVGFTDEMLTELARPEGRLYISGEHTIIHVGYYHGAYLSGERAANAILGISGAKTVHATILSIIVCILLMIAFNF